MAGQPPKKNFEGKNKSSDDYDKDWVFSNGAWVTKRQRKQDIAGQKQAKSYLANIKAQQAGTTTPPAPPTVGTAPILTNIVSEPPPPPTAPTLTPPMTGQPNVPTWWINNAITNPNEDQQFANAANALLPTLSPEDQRTLATYLSQNYKDVYGGYATTQFSEAPTEMNADIRKSYLNPQRAQLAVTLLDRMKNASGVQNTGAGYDFLKNAINLMNQFSSGGVMTREKYQQFQAAVSALGKNAGGNVGAYSNLAQLFNLPSFTAGPLVSNTPNNKLFT